MHLRHPVVLTTVEEDFKAIGILTEEDEKPTKGKVKADDADDAEEEVEGDKESSVKKSKKESTEDTDGSVETLAEKMVRLKRHTSSERLKWRRAKKRGGAKAAARKYRKKASVKRMMKKHRMKAMRLRHGKKAGRKRLVFGNDQISNMLEDVQNILGGLDEEKVENSIKAFANIAIISEMLSRSFQKFAEDAEGENVEALAEAAAFFGEMAEEAADIARTLKEGQEEFDANELGEVFKTQMADLLNGLEMYADITEDDDLADVVSADESDESDDDDEVTEEDEEEDDEEDEDDDEDEKPAAKAGKEGGKKAPPFMKKEGKKGK